MKAGIITEGTTDLPLVGALLQRIAHLRAGFEWPVSSDDLDGTLRIRKSGFGGVVEKVCRLVKFLEKCDPEARRDIYVILLDRRTEQAQRDVRRELRGRTGFVLGIAIEEIEAWWLADRRATLQWLELDEVQVSTTAYGRDRHKPEKDADPKRTLDELTCMSDACASRYGDGNTGLAEHFAEDWGDFADIAAIETACPKGFGPFARKAQEALERAHARELAGEGRLL